LPDFVLGDRFGTTCDGAFIATIEEFLRANGYTVGRNSPYAGAFVVRHYGKPKQNSHALQIEIRRSLYMNERTLEPTKGLRTIKNLMNGLMEHICRYLDEASLNELQ
jgi:N-formylglutamate amidohydrolase